MKRFQRKETADRSHLLACDYCLEHECADIMSGRSLELRPIYHDIVDDLDICRDCINERRHLEPDGATS